MRRTDILVLWAALFLQFFLLDAVPAAAGEMTFEREYTYQAGEADSKLSCRAIALEQVKRLLLEELGTYLESMTEVKNSRLTKDQITTLTAGAVQARIIDEKWDGQTYRIRARIKADPDEVAKAVQGMKEDRQKRQGLEDARRRADEAMKEIQRLRAELEALKEGTRPDTLKKYGEAVRELSAADWFQKAAGLVDSQKPQEAIEAFNKAIELDPKYGQAYNGRGFMHLILGDLQQALRDFTQSIQFDPRNPEPYNNRGIIHGRMGDMEKALQDHSRAVELGPGQWSYYQNRGLVYYEMGKIPEGMRDFTLAIDRNPGGYELYYFRGNGFMGLKKYAEAIPDYQEAIRLNPDYDPALFNLACAYSLIGKGELALPHLERAIRLKPENREAAIKDKDFDSLRLLPAFKKLVGQ